MKKLFLLLLAVLSVSLCVSAQTRTVTGTVIEAATGDPILGASVTPAGSTKGVSTDLNGKFTLQIPASVKEITVTYVGMQAVTVPVTSGSMNIALKEAANVLDQMVVVGYTQKKLASVAGSVAVVGESTFQNVTTPSFVDALQGQVAGLNIFSSSGDPSSMKNNISIRGTNSIDLDNTPLFILDGAPVSAQVFNSINPNDIASITVLKDAASVAIYGSRATNGVIMITTKRGKFDEQAITTIRANYGWSQRAGENISMMNAKENIMLREMAGVAVPDEAYELAYDYGVDTNWIDKVFNNAAPTYSIEAGIRGGSEKASYYTSLSYLDQQGIMVKSGMNRTNFRSSLDVHATPWLKLGFSTNLAYQRYQTNAYNDDKSETYIANPAFFARAAMPFDSDRYWKRDDKTGKLTFLDGDVDRAILSGFWTPAFSLNYTDRKNDRVTANINLEQVLTPYKGLTIRSRQAYEGYESRYRGVSYPHEQKIELPNGQSYTFGSADAGTLVSGAAAYSTSRYSSFTYTNTAEYRGAVDKHSFNVLLGVENILNRSEGFNVSSTGQTDVRQMLLQQGTTVTTQDIGSSKDQSVMNSFFAVGAYEFDNRYSLDLNYRRDGSSKFAPEHRWSNFWSIGGTWNVLGESFMAGTKWLNDLRLRLSYGTNGNSSLSTFQYMGLVNSYGTPYNGVSGLGIAQAPNHDLTWETTKGYDLGITTRVFDAFTLEADFYHKRTVDMILNIPFSMITGMDSMVGNIGDMTNVGADITAKYDIYKSKNWYVGARANFNYNRNRIVKLYDGQDELALPDYGLKYQVGHDCNEFYQVLYAGVNPETGAQQWYDKDGNITEEFNKERDAVLIGKSYTPPLTGGWGVDVRYKGFSLTSNFSWAAKKYMINNDMIFIENPKFINQVNQTTEMFNMWTHPGQITDIPKAGTMREFDSHMVQNASYMRLKNLTLMYSLSNKLCSKLGIQGLSVHATGRNLLTFTGFRGYDPEPGTNLVRFDYPNTRQYELGVEVSF